MRPDELIEARAKNPSSTTPEIVHLGGRIWTRHHPPEATNLALSNATGRVTIVDLMIGIGRVPYRSPYYPRWGDDKHRQAAASASRWLFGEDLAGQILAEVVHRQRRTANPTKGSQPWPIAEAKVWLRWARGRGVDAAEIRHLEALVGALYLNRIDRVST